MWSVCARRVDVCSCMNTRKGLKKKSSAARALVREVDFLARDVDTPMRPRVDEDPMLLEAGLRPRPSMLAVHGPLDSSSDLAPVRSAQPTLACRFVGDYSDCSPGMRGGTAGLLALARPDDDSAVHHGGQVTELDGVDRGDDRLDEADAVAASHPATVAVVSETPAVQATGAPETLTDFNDSLRLPLQEPPLVESTPIRRVSHRISPLVPRRSVRLAALTHHRDPRLEILRKWRPAAMPPSPQNPDDSCNEKLPRLPGAVVLLQARGHARVVPEPAPADCSSGA